MDVDERRRVVTEAAWRVLVRDGLTELSVRRVAAEAGLAPSSLRYTFPTQASVREAAVGLLIDRLNARVERASEVSAGREGARAVLLELLPLDEERRVEMEVTVSFVALAVTDETLRTAHETTHAAVRAVCARALDLLGADAPSPPPDVAGRTTESGDPSHGSGSGEPAPAEHPGAADERGKAPARAVDLTHAVVDGLALHLLGQERGDDATWAITALDLHLEGLHLEGLQLEGLHLEGLQLEGLHPTRS